MISVAAYGEHGAKRKTRPVGRAAEGSLDGTNRCQISLEIEYFSHHNTKISDN
jgi:hypothetical protein